MSTFVAFRAVAQSLCRQTRLSPTTARAIHTTPACYGNKYARSVRNEKIPYEIVNVSDAETGKLTEVPLADLLKTIDHETHFVLLASSFNRVVKIIDKSQFAAAKKEHKAAQKVSKRKQIHKEFQLTWNMAEGDLGHKLERARKELERGARVDLIFTPKHKTKAPEQSAMVEHLNEILERLQDVADEHKPMEFRRGFAGLYLKSKGDVVEEETSEQ